MRKIALLLALMAFLSFGAAQDGSFNASFDTYYQGQLEDTPSFQLSDVMPGDSGLWAVDIELNDSSSIYVSLNETFDSDDACTEPEAKAESGLCGSDGELDLEMNFTAWIDSNENLVLDPGEQRVSVDNWTQVTDPWDLLGDLSSGQERVVVKWRLPATASNAVQTDSLGFELLLAREITDDTSDGATTDSGGSSSGDGGTLNDANIKILSGGTGGNGGGSGDGTAEGRLEATVENETGNGLEGASVEVSGPESLEAETDGSGLASFNLEEGEYLVNASMDGHIHDTETTEVESGSTSEVTLVLEPEITETEEESVTEEDESSGREDQLTSQTPTGGFFQSTTGAALLFLLLVLLLVALKRYPGALERLNFSR